MPDHPPIARQDDEDLNGIILVIACAVVGVLFFAIGFAVGKVV